MAPLALGGSHSVAVVVVVVSCPGGGSSPRHVFPLVGEAQAGEGEGEEG